MEEKTTYKLYVMEATYDNVLRATAERFYRITADYILVYTSGKAPENSVEFTESDASRLSDGEAQWLFSINIELLQEQIAKETPQIIERLKTFMEELEKGVSMNGGQHGGEAGNP